MPIHVVDVVEKRTVAIGIAMGPIPGANNVGVMGCVIQPGQQLQLMYSYLLLNTATGVSVSAECIGRPGGGKAIASFHLN